ncbi:uncharacterized protein [Amphiura filiformis]|uniref:uncharacterized protein isoform X2 n=1 Tax=Amphiura filiformis TaxID=82378 RepID=UPI003B20C90E
MGDLILAAKRGVYSKVLSELRAGVPVDYQDDERATALYWTCCSGHHDICQLLLDHGANPNLPVKWGSTALHAAADRGHVNCIRLLLRYRAFVNAVNTSGDTALHLAAYRGHQDVCMILVAHEADLSIINKKGKTPHQEAQAGEHMEITRLLASKKTAQRSASYPLDQSVHPDNGQKYDDRQSSSDELKKPKTDDLKQSSLLREVLHTPSNIRPNPYMNQLSQEDRQEYHIHHRPYSDTAAVLHKERPYMDTFRVQSDPMKQGNLDVNEAYFHQRQGDAERQHYGKTVEDLQVRIAVLVSEKEALEKKLKEQEKKYSSLKHGKLIGFLDEESKLKLEKRVKELMSEVQQERRDRNRADSQSSKLSLEIEQERRGKDEADARSRQLASELFQIKSGLETPKDGSLQVETPKTEIHMVDAKCQDLPQRNFASKFCSCFSKTYLNDSSDLVDVLASVLNDQIHGESVTALKTTTCRKLETIATGLAKRSECKLSCEPGKMWTRGQDYKCVDDKAVDSQLRRQEDGLVTEIVFRIKCQSKLAAMKIILSHGRAPSLSKDVHYGSEWEILNNLPPHRNITRILHWYNQPTADLRDQIESSLNPSLGHLPDSVPILIMPEYCVSLNALSAMCSATDQVMSERCVLKILLELTKAVHYLKNNGIVHRDLEPSKVFIDDHLRVVLGEFGLARRLVNESKQPIPFVERSQIMAGNNMAWSPELMQYSSGGPPKSYQKSLNLVDVYDASDLYAIATTICHMINQAPQESPPGLDSRSNSSNQPVQVPGFLSDEAQSLLKSMLQENPQNRPTLQEIILRVSQMLFGPRIDSIKSHTDCEAWIQAQLLRLLALAPTNNSENQETEPDFEELARTSEWTLCYEYVSNVTAQQLWELCQDSGRNQ